MSAKTDTWEEGLIRLLFLNTDFTLVGDAGGLRGSVSAGSLYFSLHTADPTDTGSQTSSETSYTNYARQAVTRGAGFSITTPDTISPAADIDFPECGATPGGAITHFGLGTDLSGAGKLLYYGAVTPNITMAQGVIPRLKSTSTIVEA